MRYTGQHNFCSLCAARCTKILLEPRLRPLRQTLVLTHVMTWDSVQLKTIPYTLELCGWEHWKREVKVSSGLVMGGTDISCSSIDRRMLDQWNVYGAILHCMYVNRSKSRPVLPTPSNTVMFGPGFGYLVAPAIFEHYTKIHLACGDNEWWWNQQIYSHFFFSEADLVMLLLT